MSKRLFVGNVNSAVTEGELEEFFSEAGEVVSVRIPRDRETRAPRGLAFVEFATSDQAERAIEDLDDAVLEGRRIRLGMAHEDRRRELGQRGGGRSRKSGPERARDEPEDQPDWNELEGADSSEGYRGKPRRGGRHGSDRIRGRGTRRRLE